MNITHIYHHYYPAIGGKEYVVKQMAEGMFKMGHIISVITSNFRSENGPKKETINGVNVYRLKCLRFIYPDLTIPLEIPINLIRKTDVVHLHSQNSFFSIFFLIVVKMLRRKIILDFLSLGYLF